MMISGCSKPGVEELYQGKQALDDGNYAKAITSFSSATSKLEAPARAYNYLGIAYQRDGQYIMARDAYAKALKQDENLAQSRFNLGLLLLENQQAKLAVEQFQTFQILRPDQLKSLPYLALAHYIDRDLTAAQTVCQQFLERAQGAQVDDETIARAHNLMGLIQHGLGKSSDAYNHFHASLQSRQDHGPALWNQGMIAYPDLNRADLAVKKLREFTFRSPENPLVASARERADLLEEQFYTPAEPETVSETSETDEQQAATPEPASSSQQQASNPDTDLTEKDPTQTDALTLTTELTSLPDGETRTDDSQDLADEAKQVSTNLTETPDTPEPSTDITKTNQVSNAVPDLALIQSTESIERGNEPTEVPLENRLDVVAAEAVLPESTPQEDDQMTEAPRQRLQDLNPPPGVTPLPPGRRFNPYRYLLPGRPEAGDRRLAQPWLNRGNRAFERRNHADAIEAYEQAIALDPGFFEAYFNLGLAALNGGDPATALPAYEHALAINPNHRDSRFNLALALRQQDHLRDAARELETLLTQNKSDLPTLFQLGELYSGPLQRPVRTREIYQQIIQRHPEAIEASTARRWMQANP